MYVAKCKRVIELVKAAKKSARYQTSCFTHIKYLSLTQVLLYYCTLFFIGNRQLGNSVRFLAGNRQPQKKNRQPGGPILGPANLGNFQISQN